MSCAGESGMSGVTPPALPVGPEDEVVTIGGDDVLDDDDECPISILDPEKAHDDAC
jgi:hypothetical protein